jgi:hypothetical protein
VQCNRGQALGKAGGSMESLGFVRRSAYYDTPLPQTVFMELHLS